VEDSVESNFTKDFKKINPYWLFPHFYISEAGD
jgi:hypothetical protein